MTAQEFAIKINTPYPTVAAWLREGKVPGAQMQEVGNSSFNAIHEFDVQQKLSSDQSFESTTSASSTATPQQDQVLDERSRSRAGSYDSCDDTRSSCCYDEIRALLMNASN